MDGIAATGLLRRRPDPPDVLVLTTFEADKHVLRALRAGASGFLLKDTPPLQIIDAVRRVAAGDPMLSPRITRRLIELVAADDGSRDRAQAALAGLSSREREVVLAIAQGKSNAELAGELYLSVATVKAHVSHILAKLNLDNRTQIALLAHDAGVA
jgi:DNA-binding NarL/FixJ family response regulator